MKRHPQLEPLSDDHHNALVMARRIRRALEPAPDADALAALWSELRERFARELEPHFRVEENLLFPPLAAAGAPELAERARADHARLRALARGAPQAAAAAEFARRLHDHVRFEERELFPRAERALSPEALAAIGGAARAARPTRPSDPAPA